ncbi:STAS domain-containing protein [Pseudonocardia sp. H11422]|uniref:STAS domain-containing protein n=1 Tax=Pseudonocardia sp. H11422 TaxID=2835866 RepID=UPI001BDC04F3|nr:STAS domain-containing protein [Pseudonocardia sp. H11422]
MTGSSDAERSRGGPGQVQVTGRHQLFTVAVDKLTPRVQVVRLAGELDVLTAPQLERVLAGLLSSAPRVVFLDVSRLTFLSAAGMNVLVRAAYRAGEVDIGFCLVGASRAGARTLDAAGMGSLFETFDGIEQALGALRDDARKRAISLPGRPHGRNRRQPRQLDHPSGRRLRRNQ